MKKNTIVQFVCFVTDLEMDEFISKWEHYAKRLKIDRAETTILLRAETKSKFKYISKHEWPDGDFQFNFMNEKRSEHFPGSNVKVVQAGGYIPLQSEHRYRGNDADGKLVVFVSHDDNDIEFYRQLPSYNSLEIYQAYFESSIYGHILEYFLPESEMHVILESLKGRPYAEIVHYKECLATQD
jgi:hypothetical protein